MLSISNSFHHKNKKQIKRHFHVQLAFLINVIEWVIDNQLVMFPTLIWSFPDKQSFTIPIIIQQFSFPVFDNFCSIKMRCIHDDPWTPNINKPKDRAEVMLPHFSLILFEVLFYKRKTVLIIKLNWIVICWWNIFGKLCNSIEWDRNQLVFVMYFLIEPKINYFVSLTKT